MLYLKKCERLFNVIQEKFEIFPPKIMAACAQIGALTDANVGFDGYRCEAQNSNVFADPDMGTPV